MNGKHGIDPAPAGDSAEARVACMWARAAEAYGLDPLNPPPLRRDIVRKSFVGLRHNEDDK
jgi:hypothetical protein